MNFSKAAIVSHMILGKIFSIIGYTVGSFFLLCCFIFVSDNDMPASHRTAAIIFCLIIIGISIILIIKGAKIKRLIGRFKTYVNLISIENITSIETIASRTSQSIDFVNADMKIMIDRKFFENSYLDTKTNEIIISKQNATTPQSSNNVQAITTEIETVICSGCGALNSRQKGLTSSCEYCGSPLK